MIKKVYDLSIDESGNTKKTLEKDVFLKELDEIIDNIDWNFGRFKYDNIPANKRTNEYLKRLISGEVEFF